MQSCAAEPSAVLSAPSNDSSVPSTAKNLPRSPCRQLSMLSGCKKLARDDDAKYPLVSSASQWRFPYKIIIRTSPRELWDRSDSFSRAHLAPNERPSQVLLQPLRQQFRHPRQIYRKIDWCRSFSQPLGCYHSNLEPRQWTAPPKS